MEASKIKKTIFYQLKKKFKKPTVNNKHLSAFSSWYKVSDKSNFILKMKFLNYYKLQSCANFVSMPVKQCLLMIVK